MKNKLSILVVVVLFLSIFTFNGFTNENLTTSENDIEVGDDVFLKNYYNRIVFHESHPNFNKVHGTGGWVVGLTFDGFEPDVKQVRISDKSKGLVINKTKGVDTKVLSEERSSFGVTFGQVGDVPNNVQIRAWDLDGNLIKFSNTDGTTTNILEVKPRKDVVLPPVCEIYNMKVDKEHNEINVFIKAPYDERATAIKLFVFKPKEVVAVYIFDPPTTKEEQMKLCIPSEWSGYDASLVYVTLENDATQYRSRGVVRLTLP